MNTQDWVFSKLNPTFQTLCFHPGHNKLEGNIPSLFAVERKEEEASSVGFIVEIQFCPQKFV